MFKRLRQLFLLYVLLIVAVVQWLGHARATSWDETLWVVIHPINGDGSERSAAWIHSLSVSQFEPIARFMSEQGHGYGLAIDQPMQIVLGSEVTEQPPAPPTSGNPFAVMLWSLKLRYWTWRVDRGEQPPPADIEVYVRYFDPEQRLKGIRLDLAEYRRPDPRTAPSKSKAATTSGKLAVMSSPLRE